MRHNLLFLLMAALLTGCPPANDDDATGDDDDTAGDDDDTTGDDDDATGDDDDATGDDDDATGDDDDATGDDDDSTGSGGACAQGADHLVTMTVDPASLVSQANGTARFYSDIQSPMAGVAVAPGDTLSLELVFDPPLQPARDVDWATMTVGWSGAPMAGEGSYNNATSVLTVPAQPTATFSSNALQVIEYPATTGTGLGLQISLEGFTTGDEIGCVGALTTVPSGVASVGLDGAFAEVNCVNSFCEPDLFDGGSVGTTACGIWAENVYEVTLSAADFSLSNDGSTNGVLRYDADFTDFGLPAPQTDASYAFVMTFADPLELAGDWDLVELYFDNTYATTNNSDFWGTVPFVAVGSTSLEPTNPYNNASTNGSALEWRPTAELQPAGGPQTGNLNAVNGDISCIAYAFEGGENMLGINVVQPPSITPMSRFTIRGDCLGAGATCGSNTLGFASAP